MLDLSTLKTHLKLSLADASEDTLLAIYQQAAVSAFKVLSKRRWPLDGEPFVSKVLDASATPPTTAFVAWVDPAVLTDDEQAIAQQWQLLAIGHWYENRQSVVVDTRVAALEVPQTCDMLMSLVREPTL